MEVIEVDWVRVNIVILIRDENVLGYCTWGWGGWDGSLERELEGIEWLGEGVVREMLGWCLVFWLYSIILIRGKI